LRSILDVSGTAFLLFLTSGEARDPKRRPHPRQSDAAPGGASKPLSQLDPAGAIGY
jgi:hypothetical protein